MTSPIGTSPTRPLWRFLFGLVVVIAVALLVVSALTPPDPAPPCSDDVVFCPNPPPGGGGILPAPTAGSTAEPGASGDAFVPGSAWTSPEHGYTVVYDPDLWRIDDSGPEWLVLASARGLGFWAIFEGWRVDEQSVQGGLAAEVTWYEDRYTSVQEDDDPYKAILGPHIGFFDGVAGSWAATGRDANGLPVAPLGLGIVSATDGNLVVAFVLEVENPEELLDDATTRELAIRGLGDTLLKDFAWPR